MTKPRKPPVAKPAASNPSQWSPAELLAVRHLGPAIIGQEKYDAAQAYIAVTHGGAFGPALLGDPAFDQSGPIKVVDGVPIFAHASA